MMLLNTQVYILIFMQWCSFLPIAVSLQVMRRLGFSSASHVRSADRVRERRERTGLGQVQHR